MLKMCLPTMGLFLRLQSLVVPDAKECTYPSGVGEEKCSELFN